MAARLERIEADDPQPVLLDHILQELAFAGRVGKCAEQFFAVVVIAHQREHGAGNIGQHRSDLGKAVTVAMVGEIARQHEEIERVRGLCQPFEHRAEADAVEFFRTRVRIETDMDIGHLSDQQSVSPPDATPTLIRCPRAAATGGPPDRAPGFAGRPRGAGRSAGDSCGTWRRSTAHPPQLRRRPGGIRGNCSASAAAGR